VRDLDLPTRRSGSAAPRRAAPGAAASAAARVGRVMVRPGRRPLAAREDAIGPRRATVRAEAADLLSLCPSVCLLLLSQSSAVALPRFLARCLEPGLVQNTVQSRLIAGQRLAGQRLAIQRFGQTERFGDSAIRRFGDSEIRRDQRVSI
jgi:hypothetical protein